MASRWYCKLLILSVCVGGLPVAASAADGDSVAVSAPVTNVDTAPPPSAEEVFLAGPRGDVKAGNTLSAMSAPIPTRPPWLQETLAQASTPGAQPRPSASFAIPRHPAGILAPSLVHEPAPASGVNWLLIGVIALIAALGYLLLRRRPSTAVSDVPFTINVAPRAKTVRTPARSAFSILEVMISVCILAVALMSMLDGITTLGLADSSTKEATVVRQAAQNLCERLQGASWHLLGIPSEPWSWYRRATLPAGCPVAQDPYTYWTVWNPLTIPNPTPAVCPAGQTQYFNPPITLNGSGVRSEFLNRGQFLLDQSGVQLHGPTGQPIPIQEILVVDCALQTPPPAVVAAAQAQWSSDPNYTATTPVVGLGIFHDPPPLANLRIYVEYFNQFPAAGAGNSIFRNGAVNPPVVPVGYNNQEVCSRQQLHANVSSDTYRLAVPSPVNPVNLVYIESPDDFNAIGLASVNSSVGIRVLITWDSILDTPPPGPLFARAGTRTQEIILERRQ